jgi:thioesterase domain-containing protein
MEIKIVPDKDLNDPDPSQGAVYLRGDLIFKGYHNNDAATASCMAKDGWMDTGDIGKLDTNGNLQLLGRAKEILILNGNNYSSFDVEYAIESGNILGVTTAFTAVFSTWHEAHQSESPVVLFNPTEAAIGPRNLQATVRAIDKAVFTLCAQRALRIIPLPKNLLPKSTIGKLSRAKLKQAFEQGLFNEYILDFGQPSISSKMHTINMHGKPALEGVSPLQREIALISASIVGSSPEDLLGEDALLSSGISSIGFIRLKKALEKGLKIHQEIPMPLLLRCHSVAELEHELTLLGTVPQQYEPIVPLATGGTQHPLFLLHPGAGEFLCWVGLVKYLPNRPLYALRAKGLHPGEGTFDGLQDLLTTYYEAIRRVQPKGPYAMLGYCFGGLLSFELAKMFEAAGEKVLFCGGIDNPPNLKQTIGKLQYRALMIDILPVVTDLTADEAQAFADETAASTDEEFYEFLFVKFPPEFIENMDITVPRLKAFGRVEDCMRMIADTYIPEGKVSSVDIFCANPLPHFGATPDQWRNEVLGGWTSFTINENARFHDVPGTHIDFYKEPHIQDFQRIFNQALLDRIT